MAIIVAHDRILAGQDIKFNLDIITARHTINKEVNRGYLHPAHHDDE